MSSPFSTTSVPLWGPLDTKTDPKSVAPGSMSTAENVVYQSTGIVKQRFGQQQETNLSDTGAITAATNFGVYKNHQLLIGQGELYSYTTAPQASGAQWEAIGPLTEMQTTFIPQVGSTQAILSNVSSVRVAMGSDIVNTITVSTWTNPAGGIYYSVQDDVTKTFFVNSALAVAAPARCPILTSAAGLAVLTYVTGASLVVATLDPANPTAGFATTITTLSVFTGTPQIPIAVCIDPYAGSPYHIALAYVHTSDQVLAFQEVNVLTGAVSTLLTQSLAEAHMCNVTIQASGYTGVSGTERNFGIGATSQAGLSGVVAISGNAILYEAAGSTFTNTSGSVPESVTAFSSVTCAVGWTTPQLMNFYVGISPPATKDVKTDFFGPFTYGAWTGWPTLRAAAFATVPLSNGWEIQGKIYFLTGSAGYSSITTYNGQAAFYIADALGVPMQQLLAGTAFLDYDVPNHSGQAIHIIQNPQLSPDGTAYILGLSQVTGFFSTNTSTSGLEVQVNSATPQSVTVAFGNPTRVSIAEFNNAALINCGGVFSFDGNSLVESGFYVTPGALSAGAFTMTGGMTAGTYTYQAIFYWVDLQGNQFLSGPSLPLTIVLTGSENTVLIGALPLSDLLTRKTDPNNPVFLKLYRTTVDSSGPFYPVGTYPNDGLAITDGLADVDLEIKGPFLYAPDDNSGEVPNGSPPGFLAMVATKTRVFGVSQEDPTQIWYTKPLVPKIAASWSGVFTVTVESAGGIPTALGALDTTLAIFKTSRLYTLPGDGPDANGSTANGSFGYPQLLSSAAGCVVTTSVGLTDLGLFFQSARGLEMLTRASAVNYTIGLPVYEYRSFPITSVVSVPDQDHIRFGTIQGTTLVYDYVQEKWATFTNYGSIGAGYWNNAYVRCDGTGAVYAETEDLFTDVTFTGTVSAVNMVLETAWLKPNQISQGFSRIRRYAVFGTYKSAHLLRIDIGINYQDYSISLIWNPMTGLTQLLPAEGYGDGSPYGSDAVYGGGVAPTYQLRARTPIQKCESMRWKFTTLPNLVSGTGEACELIDLALELVQKTGLMRLQPGQTK